MKNSKQDIVLIGAGIMSTTLAVLLKRLNPNFNIKIYEMLDTVAEESSSALNNAGTGHSGFCELNYTPQKADGSVDIKKAVEIAAQYMISKEFWANLVTAGYIQDPESFIHSTPHYSFVNNEKDIKFLKNRYETLKDSPFFKEMKYSQNPSEIASWLPLVMAGRNEKEPVACTKVEHGTDVDFESLTKQILNSLIAKKEVELYCSHMVQDLRRSRKGNWSLKVMNLKTKESSITKADFVFLGAGGGSILLLEKSQIPESHGYGGFPVGGEWLICENPEVVQQHQAKVYGQAPTGAPPMSVPHLDTRIINGERKLLFGPFAVFSTKFLKNGSHLDLFKSLQVENIAFMTQAGWRNMNLTKYLIQQASLSKKDKVKTLKKYLPQANANDWVEQSAGQRVQIIKKLKEKGGVLEFGTEVVGSEDGSLVALLGASPGASTSVYVMLEVLKKCFAEYESPLWQEKLHQFIPSLGSDFNDSAVKEATERTNKILKLK